MDTKAVLTTASELIREKRYREARAMLVKLDHPVAEQWINKIDALLAKEASTSAVAPTRAKTTSTTSVATPQSAKTTEAAAAKTKTAPIKSTQEKSKNSDKLPISGIIIAFLCLIIVGIGGGILLFLSSKITYLIFLSPLIAALVVGAIMGQALKIGKVRDGLAAAIMAGVMGVLAYGTYRYAEYLDFVQVFHDETVADYGELTVEEHAELDVFINEMLVADTGQSGFIGFVLMQGQQGMTVESTRVGRSPTTWSKEMTLLYWGAEILGFLLIPAGMALGTTSEPFCEDTGNWMEFKKIGTVAGNYSGEFLNLLNQGAFLDAARVMRHNNGSGNGSLTIRVGRCHSESPEAMIRIKQQNGRNEKEILKQTITPEQYNDLISKVI